MKSTVPAVLAALVLFVPSRIPGAPANLKPAKPQADPDESLAQYFRYETARLTERCLADVRTLEDWQARREEYRRQLLDMLGLWPMPERTRLNPVVTGNLEQVDFTVEKLQFQAMPHLYVTGDLYLPKRVEKPAPAILYVCGHAKVVTNGVSCGNKAGYQHHGAWFARNGYVCLMIDTVQLGEIEGMHHGTYRENQWWWNSRGYTPAGVEAWFGIRALDYLCSRPEVDKERIGMTGRSGGGAYTWTVAALDDRVKVAAPVAGMTDLQNQVVDGAVDEHCDCMFFLNKYRWDFPQLAALIAPRPLLIANTDKDGMFPLDGVVRLYQKTKRVYQLYGQATNVGLLITEGPHADSQDLQVPVFRWFNRFLKSDKGPVEMVAKPCFAPDQLRVFDTLPADQVNTRIQETFVPMASIGSVVPADQTQEWKAKLREEVFRGWPEEGANVVPALCGRSDKDGLRREVYLVEAQPGVPLKLYLVRPKARRAKQIVLQVLDAQTWTNSPAKALWLDPDSPGRELPSQLALQVKKEQTVLAFFAPRAVEPAKWMSKPGKLTQVRRRYMLLGQTLDSMRVWDIRCAVRAMTGIEGLEKGRMRMVAQGQMGVNAAYAALFEPGVERIELQSLPASHRDGPDYLQVLKLWDIAQLMQVLGPRLSRCQ